ncbi:MULTISPECIES: hypothetical protein [Halocynthiibacter]|uniref:Uncharacterized protein n=1 Tax=Halocynthiibacter halioticoli TaxID=2986804 RepID=A0AAE3IXS3_9RHOB|nr:MULTISPECIES: hypothetical protein [Halocynthiibacter]MCV6824073.1 hypothetical protein [Halocynthiibacter halioticoli]MCW4057074.1 hypothetical protein [Halocynthiibacter sp. SDUM655004]
MMLDQARARARASAEATAEAKEQGQLQETQRLERLPYITMCKGGYAIQMPTRAGFWVRLTQGVATLVAVCAFSFAAGMWLMPGSSQEAGLESFKMIATLCLLMVGTLAVYFLSQRPFYQLQIDQTRREVRETLCSRNGKELVLRRCAFDEVSSIYLSRDKAKGKAGNEATLMMRHAAYPIEVLTEDADYLKLLRDLLARDVLGMNVTASLGAVTTERSAAVAASVAA